MKSVPVRSKVLLLSLLLPFAVTSGCSWIASTTSAGTEALGNLLLSPQQEKQLGSQLAAQVKQQQQVHPDPVVQSYVDRVAQSVLSRVPKEKRAEYDFTFTVLDDPRNVNAFALPGGHIFVMSGLLEAVDSEAELAAVLSHELAHVLAGHPSQQLAAQVGLQTLASLALGQQSGMLAQLAANIAGTGYLAAHTREMEREADSLGVGYLSSAGYDPAAMADFFTKLARLHGSSPNFVESFLASHPAPAARAQRIDQLIAERKLPGEKQAVVGGLEGVQQRLGTAIGGSGE